MARGNKKQRAKHNRRLRAVSAQLAKEAQDRLRTGAPGPGDRCRARRGSHTCYRMVGHSKLHRDCESGFTWKVEKVGDDGQRE